MLRSQVHLTLGDYQYEIKAILLESIPEFFTHTSWYVPALYLDDHHWFLHPILDPTHLLHNLGEKKLI